jgi:hypothetical protein
LLWLTRATLAESEDRAVIGIENREVIAAESAKRIGRPGHITRSRDLVIPKTNTDAVIAKQVGVGEATVRRATKGRKTFKIRHFRQ